MPVQVDRLYLLVNDEIQPIHNYKNVNHSVLKTDIGLESKTPHV